MDAPVAARRGGRDLGTGLVKVIMAAFLLTACTTPSVRDTSAIDAKTANCETVDCVIELMDTLPQGPDSDRFPFMEGVSDPRLADLKKQNRLDVDTLNPLLLLLGIYGMATVDPKPMGGISRCKARYMPGLNWISLKHELAHCQGYADHGIPIEVATYTPEQQEIMARERVNKWTDTKYYRGMTQ